MGKRALLLLAIIAVSAWSKNQQYDKTGVQMWQKLQPVPGEFHTEVDGHGYTCNEVAHCYKDADGDYVVQLADGRVALIGRYPLNDGDPLLDLAMSARSNPQTIQKDNRLFIFNGRFSYRLVIIKICNCEGIAVPFQVKGKTKEALYMLTFWNGLQVPSWPADTAAK